MEAERTHTERGSGVERREEDGIRKGGKEEGKREGEESRRTRGEAPQEARRNWSHSAGQEPCGRDGGNGTKEDHAGDYNINKQMSLEAGEFAIQWGTGGGREAEPPPTNLEGPRRTFSPSSSSLSSSLLRSAKHRVSGIPLSLSLSLFLSLFRHLLYCTETTHFYVDQSRYQTRSDVETTFSYRGRRVDDALVARCSSYCCFSLVFCFFARMFHPCREKDRNSGLILEIPAK